MEILAHVFLFYACVFIAACVLIPILGFGSFLILWPFQELKKLLQQFLRFAFPGRDWTHQRIRRR